MYNILIFFSMLLFVIALLRHFGETRHIFKVIEERYPEKWDALGHPRWGIQFGDPTLREALNYIRHRTFRELNDDDIELAYRRLKNAERLALFSALSVLGLMVLDTMNLSF